MMVRKKLVFVALSLWISLTCGGIARAGVFLPGSALALQYGDFDSYSLPYLQYLSDKGLFGLSGDFAVKSTPGDIKDGIVIGTGAAGVGVTDNFAGMNDAYAMPQGAGSPSFFNFNTATNPGNSFAAPAGDTTISWDADVAALNSFLATGGGDFAIFFNLNEEGQPTLGDAGLESTDLLAWAEVTLATPTNGGLAERKFYFSAFDNPFTLGDERAPGLLASIAGGPDETVTPVVGSSTHFDTLDSRWGIAHSTLTVDNTTGFVTAFGPVGGGNTTQIDQNLGANQAAFAVFNSELNDLIKAQAYRDFRMSFRDARISNGFEQIFVLNDTFVNRQPPVNQIPEPCSLIVWSLMGVATVGWRRRCC